MPEKGACNRITYVGHATVLIELDGLRILTDPVLRARIGHLRRQVGPAPAAVAEELDAVLLSHLHLDHADRRSLRRIDPATPVLAPAGSGFFLRRRGFRDVTELAPGGAVEIGAVRIAAVEARHRRGRSPLTPASGAIGFDLTGSRRVYFAGDTDLFEGMRELAGELDLALLPVWGWGSTLGPGHLDPERAARAAAILSPRLAVPIHWGTYLPLGLARRHGRLLTDPPRDFARCCADLAPRVEVRVLAPGESSPMAG